MSLTIVALIAFCAHVVIWVRLPARKTECADVEMGLERQIS